MGLCGNTRSLKEESAYALSSCGAVLMRVRDGVVEAVGFSDLRGSVPSRGPPAVPGVGLGVGVEVKVGGVGVGVGWG